MDLLTILFISVILTPVLSSLIIVGCFLFFHNRHWLTQFEFAKKLSSEIQSIKEYFRNAVWEREAFAIRCERCGAERAGSTKLCGGLHAYLCKRCMNEWDVFIRKTSEFEELSLTEARVHLISEGGISVQTDKFDEIYKAELSRSRKAIDTMKVVGKKWLKESDHKRHISRVPLPDVDLADMKPKPPKSRLIKESEDIPSKEL